MQCSAAGLQLLKRSEGFRGRVYRDVAGVPTIGYGHRLRRGESFPNGIEKAQALEILASDVREAERTVEHLVKVPLTQGQFDALTDFVFNLGSGRLAASTLLSKLNESNYKEAVDQLLRWDHAGSSESAALKARRESEAALWLKDSARDQAVASLSQENPGSRAEAVEEQKQLTNQQNA
jgi:lysozyme